MTSRTITFRAFSSPELTSKGNAAWMTGPAITVPLSVGTRA